MLTRGKVIVIIFLFSTILWIYNFDKYKKSNSLIKWILIPIYLVGLLSAYAIVSISISLYNFNNVPNGHEALLDEINNIKKELEKKKFTFS
ncbi:dolichol-phosphate mannosyltransferase subunit 3, putative [Plasmodium malariae]|uniref:Dolichol-phosphate mannosyltransferase subunit 3 n=1 Tax=Plasmodium malariae TaxID=5858 RepID=A0A1D3RHC8_PLAMA|nr:dolichol-phosphate mannosyltransferase subunit 3, putative [Plasmodium malariae]SCN44579.1 dolichol-phosphate mannosyltransferase subunit 3, putative [Plasmodium malariae]